MCTLTYIPKNDGFILTSNRDEAKSRKVASFPAYKEINEQKVLFPQDGDAFGSWIATSNKRLVNLLNGAWEKYKHEPPYRKSRGIVLLESFEYDELKEFAYDYNFDNIAPFTLVGLDYKSHLKMEVLRWDGKSISYKEINPNEAHIFSSAPLYPEHIRLEREKLFAKFLQDNEQITASEMVNFHQFGGNDNAPIKLSEDHFVHTISITSVVKNGNELSMKYHDLIQNEVKVESLQNLKFER